MLHHPLDSFCLSIRNDDDISSWTRHFSMKADELPWYRFSLVSSNPLCPSNHLTFLNLSLGNGSLVFLLLYQVTLTLLFVILLIHTCRLQRHSTLAAHNPLEMPKLTGTGGVGFYKTAQLARAKVKQGLLSICLWFWYIDIESCETGEVKSLIKNFPESTIDLNYKH